MDVLGQHHAGLAVADLEASAAWYRDLLGFEVDVRWQTDDGSVRMAMISRGTARVELFETDDDVAGPDEERPLMEQFRRRGWKHLALEVPDLDVARSELEQAGVPLLSEPAEGAAGTVRYLFIRDPDGNPVELLEVLSPASPRGPAA